MNLNVCMELAKTQNVSAMTNGKGQTAAPQVRRLSGGGNYIYHNVKSTLHCYMQNFIHFYIE